LQAKEIKKIVSDPGMTIRSGHVHYDDSFQQSIDGAAEAGQEAKSGMKYFFVEQEKYAGTPLDSLRINCDYLSKPDV